MHNRKKNKEASKKGHSMQKIKGNKGEKHRKRIIMHSVVMKEIRLFNLM